MVNRSVGVLRQETYFHRTRDGSIKRTKQEWGNVMTGKPRLVMFLTFLLFSSVQVARATTTIYVDRASFSAAASGITTVDFNGIAPAGDFVPYGPGGSFTLGGITFSTNANTFLYVVDQGYFPACYTTGSGGGVGTAAYGSPSVLNISLPSQVSAIGFDTNTFGSSTIAITLSTGEVLNYATNDCSSRFVGFTTDVAITSLSLSTANVGVNIDDFAIGTAGCQLPVTRLTQFDPRWGANLYDHSASLTIRQKGCALTSLSMALNSAGMSTDPGSLNQFMTTTDNDYNGLSVNWGPATRDVSGSALLKFHAARLTGQSAMQYLDAQVCQQGHPVIVGVDLDAAGNPGHFVVVTGKSGSDFKIADPGFNRTVLSDYGNQFETRGFVADPPGDISELDIAIGDAADFLIIDPAGYRLGIDPATGQVVEELSNSAYFRDGLVDDLTGEAPREVARTGIIGQPILGTYQLSIMGTKLGVYTLSIRAFSQDGSPQPEVALVGIAAIGSMNVLSVQSQPSVGGSPSLQRIATFQDTLADINNSVRLGLIDNQGIANSLSQKLRAAQKANAPARNNILFAFINEVNAQTGKHISRTAAQVLLQDANSLRQK